MAAAAMPMKKGQRRRRLTPKMAGSVMPKSADAPPAPARPFILASRVLKKTARAAAPCATFAMEAIGKMKEPMPPLIGEQRYLDGGEGLVQTGDDDRRVDEAEEQATDGPRVE